jgi:ribosomal-protein-alanine N-acetyltransferase
MLALRIVTESDEAPVLAFELENRAYFARFVSDRSDEFFEEYSREHRNLLAEQEAGTCVFHILVDSDDTVVGRVNLHRVQDGTADLGYRLAERVTGRGVASEAVARVILLARDEYGLSALKAVVSDTNIGSKRVLEKAGFSVTGPAEINGRPAKRYELDLAAGRGQR